MHTTVYVLAVIFIATLIRSTFGFGEALVAVPLLNNPAVTDESPVNDEGSDSSPPRTNTRTFANGNPACGTINTTTPLGSTSRV